MPYHALLVQKTEHIKKLLLPFYEGEIESFSSPDRHYRARAEFRVWHEGSRCDYAMGRLDRKGSLTICECPKVIEPIARRMRPLLDAINASPEVIKSRLFGVEFLAATTGECLITLLYHRKLDALWESEARRLAESLDAQIIGRSRKQKVVLDRDYVTEQLKSRGRTITYQHHEGGFTQPNPAVNARMIEWVERQAASIGGGDLLECYCGLGNFTLPLAAHFGRVLATEISKRSIASAQTNQRRNAISNVSFVRLASEEVTEALEGRRSFRRLAEISLDTYRFSTVLVDPPRAGLDESTARLARTIPNILYISCNPKTLARDLVQLTQTHEVVSAALFDQFPYTDHIECGVWLRQRSGLAC
jgi:tRNA (uracil-5-)-methyltransferase